MKTLINSQPAEWPPEVKKLWKKHVAPLFSKDERCSDANYFTPRPYVDEYNKGSKMTGFVYVVQPGNRVAFKEWIWNAPLPLPTQLRR